MPAGLPSLPRLLLHTVLPAEVRETMLDELAEEYRRYAGGAHRMRVMLWLWRETLSLAFAYRWAAVRHGRSRDVTVVTDARRLRWRSLRYGYTAERDRRFSALGQDLRHGVRALMLRPRFTLAALLTIAVGIGANAAILMVLQASVLRPLPYPDANELVWVHQMAPQFGISAMGISAPDFADLKAQNRSFEGLAAYHSEELTLTGEGEPRLLQVGTVGYDGFTVLGISPAHGRSFVPADELPENEETVILSDRLWRSLFGADEQVLGRPLTLEGRSRTVVGVMPAGFDFPGDADLWVPLRLEPDLAADRKSGVLWGVGRLADGVNLAEGLSDLERVQEAINLRYPERDEVLINAVSLRAMLYREVNGPLFFFYGIVTLVLLLACANTANLMLAFYSTRETEFGIRTSLGAGRGRIIRQILTESLLLATVGGAFGVALAQAGRSLLLASIPVPIPAYLLFVVNWRVLLAVAAVIAVVAVLSGIAPALASGSVSPARVLAPAGGHTTADVRRSRLRTALIFTEMAMASLILIAGVMMFQSYARFQQTDPGFDPEGVLTARLDLPASAYPDEAARRAFFAGLVERLRALPGVVAAGAAQELPLSRLKWGRYYTVAGAPLPDPGRLPITYYWLVEGNYFEAMGLRLIQGRWFSSLDRGEAPRSVIVISRTFALRWWPEGEAVGRQVKWGPPESSNPWMTVIGVVEDIDERAPGQDMEPSCYLPASAGDAEGMYLVLRTGGDPLELVAPLKGAVWTADPNLPLVEVRTMASIMQEEYWPIVLSLRLIGVFSAITLALAALGIYSVIAYNVSRRTRELGIRLALGARNSQITRLVLHRVAWTCGSAMALGMLVAFAFMRLLAGQLRGLIADDPATYVLVAAMLGTSAFLAGWLPARRATRVDPMQTLRTE